MEKKSVSEIKILLSNFHDIPEQIKTLYTWIKELKEEQRLIGMSSPAITGMPGGKGGHGDPTGNLALNSDPLGTDIIIKQHYEEIRNLTEQRNW